jgi:glycosyl transferase family 2
VTRDGLKPWKRLERLAPKIKELGLEWIVAIDSRTKDGTRKFVFPYASRILDYRTKINYGDGALNNMAGAATGDMCAIISDDEEPSPRLWEFIASPTEKAAYAVKLVAPMPNLHDWYKPGTELQCRIFRREGWKWIGAYDGRSVGAMPSYVKPDLILWHYAIHAPYKYRLQKTRDYIAMMGADQGYIPRQLYEGNEKEIEALPPEWLEQLPK